MAASPAPVAAADLDEEGREEGCDCGSCGCDDDDGGGRSEDARTGRAGWAE